MGLVHIFLTLHSGLWYLDTLLPATFVFCILQVCCLPPSLIFVLRIGGEVFALEEYPSLLLLEAGGWFIICLALEAGIL